MKNKRPSIHYRVINTRRGRKRVLVNPMIRKMIRRRRGNYGCRQCMCEPKDKSCSCLCHDLGGGTK